MQGGAGAYCAAHSDDVAYVFGDLGMRSRWHGDARPPRRIRMAEVVTYWVNFAKHGDPNGPGLPKWPRYERRMMNCSTCRRRSSHEPRKAQLEWLDEGYERPCVVGAFRSERNGPAIHVVRGMLTPFGAGTGWI